MLVVPFLVPTGAGGQEPCSVRVRVANFLRYVDGGFYDGGAFHRTVHPDNQPGDSVKISVIQGDIARDRRADRFGAIDLERTRETGVRHVDGAISMARSGPDTGTSSFFVCLGDQPDLDYGGKRNPDGQGFAAFGLVVQGMDVVRAINRAPAEGQSLSPPIRILRIHRVQSREPWGFRRILAVRPPDSQLVPESRQSQPPG